MLLTGRGFGKSRAAAEWLIDSALNEEPGEWCVIARNAADVRKNARDQTAGLVVCARDHLKQYNRHEEDIYLDNGSVIHCLSADKPDRLRGFNLMGAWVDELASWRFMEDTWEYGLLPTLRVGRHPRVVITTTPKPVPLLKKLVKEAQAEEEKPLARRSKVLVTGSTWENAKNLADNFIAEMRTSFEGTRVGRQELEGELIFDLTGTLVNAEQIHNARITPSELEEADIIRVAVGVDPAGSYGEESDETGIVVCAKDRDNHGYVLEDKSGKYTPQEWAGIAAALYQQWEADALVAEVNVGGNLVEEVVRSALPHVRFVPVRAVVGKFMRAEPVTALYEQGRIHHVGTFARLEDQLCTWTPDMQMKGTRGKSPDRMDAMVHAFTELGLARYGVGRGWIEAIKGILEEQADKPAKDISHIKSWFADAPRVSSCTERRFGFDGICWNCGMKPEEHRETSAAV